MIPNLPWEAQETALYVDSPEQSLKQQIGCIRCDEDDPAPSKIYMMNGMSMCFLHAHAQDFTNTHGEAEQ